MKKITALILILVLSLSVFGCAKQESSLESSGEYTLPDHSDDDSESFGSFAAGSIDLSGIETYETPKDVVVEFEIGDFKLNNVDNFSESDMSKIDSFTEDELKELAITKAELLEKLTIAFKNAGINVDINETSGEVSLDSSVLFGGDSAVLSDAGKDFLKKFISTYAEVVFADEFDGFISKIYVEGHTAPISGSTYESGLPLSEERADTVKNYCVSAETGVSADGITKLTSMLEAVGMSNSKPVKDSSGNVDVAASRRVSFRFLINLDK